MANENPYQPPALERLPPPDFSGTVVSRVTYSPLHYLETISRFRRQPTRNAIWNILRLLVWVVLMSIAFITAIAGVTILSAMALFMALIVFFTERLGNFTLLTHFHRDPNCNGPLMTHLSEEGLRTEMKTRQTDIPWQRLSKAFIFQDGVLIWGTNGFYWIPDDSLESCDDPLRLRTLVQSKLPVKNFV